MIIMKNDWKFLWPQQIALHRIGEAHAACAWEYEKERETGEKEIAKFHRTISYSPLKMRVCGVRSRNRNVFALSVRTNVRTYEAIETLHFAFALHSLALLYSSVCIMIFSLHAFSHCSYCTLIWTWHRHFMPAACFIKFTALPNHTSYLAFVPERASMQKWTGILIIGIIKQVFFFSHSECLYRIAIVKIDLWLIEVHYSKFIMRTKSEKKKSQLFSVFLSENYLQPTTAGTVTTSANALKSYL